MPIYESACKNSDCNRYAAPIEFYAPRFSSPNPDCASCGQQTARLISTFAICWTGGLSKYNSTHAGVQQRTMDSHVAWRINSSRRADGKPERVVIDSIAKQKEYCRAEGLRLPSDINPNASVSDDGKKLYTNGMRGQWF